MVLRALLPAGYIPAAQDGALRIVMCSVGLALPTGDNDHNSGDGNQLPSVSEDCPFAHASLSTPPIQFMSASIERPRDARFDSSTADSLPPSTGPPRTTAARAPPALS
jgi:hypothetical protein